MTCLFLLTTQNDLPPDAYDKKKLCDDDEGNKISNKQEMSKNMKNLISTNPNEIFVPSSSSSQIFNRVSVCIH